MEAIEGLVERLRAQGVGTSREINPFWRRLLEPLGTTLETGERITPDLLNKVLGYGAVPLAAGTSNRDLRDWPRLLRAAQTRDLAGLAKQTEHAGMLAYLNDKGVLDEYVDYVDRLRLVSNLNTGRLFWYRRRLLKVLRKTGRQRPQPFLEIGAGSGMFAAMMADAGVVSHYVMVDLPEMLLNAMLFSARWLPDMPLRFGDTPDLTGEPAFWFLETDQIRQVPDGAIAVAINFNSFMEMDPEVRDFYIGEVYRTAEPGAVFYNVNRRQMRMTRRDGAAFDSNPLLYPYQSSDRIVEWEPDECQQSCRSWVLRTPSSFTISRIAQVAGG